MPTWLAVLIVIVAVLIVAAAFAVSGDVRRYLRMRRM